MNSYEQPENKLTYNFLCLLEHMDGFKEFCEYLMDETVALANHPLVEIETVFSGYQSNPDGKICVKAQNKDEYTIYLENKTFRSGLDEKQLINHLSEHCREDNSFLLVTTPRITDQQIINKLGNKKVFFKTWSKIANKLADINRSLPNPSFVISQFIEYGELSGEFTDMENLTKEEIGFYINTIKLGVERKISHIFERLRNDFDFEQYGFNNVKTGVKKHWGRHGIEIYFDPRNDYGQWCFFGIYFDTTDHGLKFKMTDTPELALFFDCHPSHMKSLQHNREFRSALENLCKKGFEDNLSKNLASKWRLVFWRKPLTEIEDFSYDSLKTIFQDKLSLLCEEDAFTEEML